MKKLNVGENYNQHKAVCRTSKTSKTQMGHHNQNVIYLMFCTGNKSVCRHVTEHLAAQVLITKFLSITQRIKNVIFFL